VRRAWLLLSFGDERQYAGNPGYLDELQQLYRYDSFVPNHKQVAEGDYVFIRDKYRLQGVARIEKIRETSGEKLRSRCPACGTTGLKIRETLSPRYRCTNKHEFETPKQERASCQLYSAEYGSTFLATPEALSLQELRDACPRPSDQLAIQEIDWERVFQKLLEKHPAVQVLFSTNGGMQKTDVVEESVSSNVPPEQFPQEVHPSQIYYEGAVTRVLVNAYERNAAARKACIASWGCKCWVCGFDFEAVYGELGQGFVHVHHLQPLSEIGFSYQLDPVLDLRPVCPNCHAMLHRKVPTLTLDALERLLRDPPRR
jgi:hypothetical protein